MTKLRGRPRNNRDCDRTAMRFFSRPRIRRRPSTPKEAAFIAAAEHAYETELDSYYRNVLRRLEWSKSTPPVPMKDAMIDRQKLHLANLGQVRAWIQALESVLAFPCLLTDFEPPKRRRSESESVWEKRCKQSFYCWNFERQLYVGHQWLCGRRADLRRTEGRSEGASTQKEKFEPTKTAILQAARQVLAANPGLGRRYLVSATLEHLRKVKRPYQARDWPPSRVTVARHLAKSHASADLNN